MARSIWSGSVSFGLVNVPVKLYTAVQRKTVHFHQLHDADGARIQQRRVCSADGEEVPFEHIVKGFELSADRYVMLEPAELDSLAAAKTKLIEIELFVDLAEIDPLLFDQPYYLAPAAGSGKAYRLMLDAMRDAGKVAIGRFVLRQKEHLVALRAQESVLVMETLVYADEVVPPSSIEDVSSAEVEVSERELAMAGKLIEMLSGPFEPERYRDEYREAVLSLIERKAAGEEIALAPAPAAPKAVPDLMAALQASVAAVGQRTAAAANGDGAPAAKPKRRAAAKPKAPARPKATAKPARKS